MNNEETAIRQLIGAWAYRETWPSLFRALTEGRIRHHRLLVNADDRVAFATALLRCGSREELAKDDTPRQEADYPRSRRKQLFVAQSFIEPPHGQ